jgi:hypothetical protein
MHNVLGPLEEASSVASSDPASTCVSLPHLRKETDSVPETCSFGIPDDGQSPKTQQYWNSFFVTKKQPVCVTCQGYKFWTFLRDMLTQDNQLDADRTLDPTPLWPVSVLSFYLRLGLPRDLFPSGLLASVTPCIVFRNIFVFNGEGFPLWPHAV